jgi:hypothetical protein
MGIKRRRGQYWRAENLSSVRRKTLCSIIRVWASCCSRPSDDVRHRRFRSSRTGRRLLLVFVHRQRLGAGRCAGVVGAVKKLVLLGGGPKDMRQQGNIFASAFCSIPQDFDINSSVKFSKKQWVEPGGWWLMNSGSSICALTICGMYYVPTSQFSSACQEVRRVLACVLLPPSLARQMPEQATSRPRRTGNTRTSTRDRPRRTGNTRTNTCDTLQNSTPSTPQSG